MSTVLAALDGGTCDQVVLDTAFGIGALTGSVVEAVHVADASGDSPEALARRNGVALRELSGSVEDALLAALAVTDVVGAVLGTRGQTDETRSVGRTALRVLEAANKPVVVVPPDTLAASSGVFRRLLVPLEGTEASSLAVVRDMSVSLVGEIEMVVLHVFTYASCPRILDHPTRDVEMIGGEFLARHCPVAEHIEMRVGEVGAQVAEVRAEREADLVMLSWSQSTSEGRAAVVRDVLAHSLVPVVLVPVVVSP